MPDPEREPDGSHFEGGVIIITEQETIQDLVARVLTEIKTHHYAATTQAGYCSFFYRQLTNMRSVRAYSTALAQNFFPGDDVMEAQKVVRTRLVLVPGRFFP